MFGLINKKKSKKTSATNTQRFHFQVGDHSLPVISSKRRKSIAVKLRKSGLIIEVPSRVSSTRIEQTLEAHSAWLLSQVERLTQLEDDRFTGQQGEAFELFGKVYRCHWLTAQNDEFETDLPYRLNQENATFEVLIQPEDSELENQLWVQRQVVDLMQNRAKAYLSQATDRYAELMQLEYKSMTVKGYKSRWGSCYPDGRIQFNWRLTQAPEWVVDYVVVHELAHIVHHNHSKLFWQLVEQYYPQTKLAKAYLKKQGPQMINLLQS